MPYTLPPAPPQKPPKPAIQTWYVAALYLPTIGTWALLRAVRYYLRNRLG